MIALGIHFLIVLVVAAIVFTVLAGRRCACDHCRRLQNLEESARYARTLLRNGGAAAALRELEAALSE